MKKISLSAEHYSAISVVVLIAFVMFVGLISGKATMALDVIVETDLSGLFFFTGAVIAVGAWKNPASHRFAELALLSGLFMSVIHLMMKGLADAVENNAAMVMVANLLSIFFYCALVTLFFSTYLCFKTTAPDQSKSRSEER